MNHEIDDLKNLSNLVCWRPLSDDNVSGVLHDGNAIRVQQLTISFSTFAKLELESAFLVEYLKDAGLQNEKADPG